MLISTNTAPRNGDHAPALRTELGLDALPRFPTSAKVVQSDSLVEPVYCLHAGHYRQTARRFVAAFPGRVLYAVKANDHPAVLELLQQGGVQHFDCASLPEIERVRSVCPQATPYFMIPVRLPGAAREARERFAVRHFMVDHARGIELLAEEVDLTDVTVFVRMAVHHPSAMQDLSVRFGAPPDDVPGLLRELERRGAEPALAFNVGSSVTQAEAYQHAIDTASRVLGDAGMSLRLIDIGGGFPLAYPGFDVPELDRYHATVRQAMQRLPMTADGELMAEPGRALAGPGMSALVRVLLRKEDRLYINDGMYGIFWELRFKGHQRFPVRVFRDGSTYRRDELQEFRLFGPTCDSSDVLPGAVPLPADIREGDVLEFGRIGAYSLSGRTHFNGFFSDRVVLLTDPHALPPED